MKSSAQNKKTGFPKQWIFFGTLAILTVVLLILVLRDPDDKPPIIIRTLPAAHVTVPDTDGQRATRYDLTTAEEAQAYFVRLLDSEFIGLRGDAVIPAELIDGKWHAREENGDGTELTAVFDTEGIVSSLFIGTNRSGEMSPSLNPYSLEDDESLYQYVRSFAFAWLPDVSILSGSIVSDQYNEEGRFVTLQTATNYTDPAFSFVVQVEPDLRIVGFSVLADEADAFLRSSQKAGESVQPASGTPPTEQEAVAIARSYLSAVYGIPKDEVDTYLLVNVEYRETFGDIWYGYETPAPYWAVSFHLPNDESKNYSDYDLLIDAATGEVLQIFDPTNNSNG